MNKVIAKGNKAREEMVKGADFLADIVVSTLGPYGQNVFLDKKNTITNDGKTTQEKRQKSYKEAQQALSAGASLNDQRGCAASCIPRCK